MVRLVFIVNHAAFFVSHRLPIAVEALRRGWEVTLITGMAGSDSMERDAEEKLKGQGITHHRLGFGSATISPLRELKGLMDMVRLLRKLHPDLVHGVSPKGILYGGIAARLAGVPSLVLAVSGMGYAFAETGRGDCLRSLVGKVISMMARISFRHGNRKVIVQNLDDMRWISGAGLCQECDIRLIPGSGVDLGLFRSRADVSAKHPIVVFPARLLRDKGVVEFAEAARRIRKLHPDWRFILAGTADYRNPSMVARGEIDAWVAAGTVEWSGHVDDIATLLCAASIVCLPSYYREGLPKALLEAAAAGCAVVTTDSTGCREAIVPGATGILVPPRNVDALTNALLELISDRNRREAYGDAGKRLAEEKYSLEAVLASTFDLYAILQARA